MQLFRTVILITVCFLSAQFLNAQPLPPGGGHGQTGDQAPPGGGAPIGSGLTSILILSGLYLFKKRKTIN
jgi:hypothetical protein